MSSFVVRYFCPECDDMVLDHARLQADYCCPECGCFDAPIRAAVKYNAFGEVQERRKVEQ